MKVLQIQMDGRLVKIHAQKLNGKVWLHLNGNTLVYEEQNHGLPQSKQKGIPQSGELLAPMPGKITRILKNIGDSVNKGEALIIMEAMKMEYTLKAISDGQVVQMNCQLGEQVSLGKVLGKVLAKVVLK